jgi:hypothetical protein
MVNELNVGYRCDHTRYIVAQGLYNVPNFVLAVLHCFRIVNEDSCVGVLEGHGWDRCMLILLHLGSNWTLCVFALVDQLVLLPVQGMELFIIVNTVIHY